MVLDPSPPPLHRVSHRASAMQPSLEESEREREREKQRERGKKMCGGDTGFDGYIESPLQVSFAKYCLFYGALLQKRPMI